jgi:hypothetical protein
MSELPPDVLGATKTDAYERGWQQGIQFERRRCADIAKNQPLYPDTQTGKRQQWVKDRIAEKIISGHGKQTL